MSDVEELCARLGTLGVDEDTIATARRDLSAHAHQELNWLQLAVHLRHIRQFEASLETYEVAARRFPNSARLWNNRGVLLREHGYLDKAIASFEKALELKPDYVHAIESRAIAYEKLQDFTTASSFYKQALSLDKELPLCWNNLGNCLRMQGFHVEAIDCYQKAVRYDPEYMDSLFNLASLQYERKDYAEALRTIERCAVLNPADLAVQALRDEIKTHPVEPKQVDPGPLHGSGYTLRLSTNIDEHGNVIHPDFSFDRILSGDEICAMSREDAARVVGTQMWDQLHLRRLVQQALLESDPPPHGSPIFISYCWGDPTHSEWVSGFVSDLVQRGYDVVFDRNAEKEKRPPSVPELITRMTRCSLFVAMFTNRYTRRVLVSPDSFSPVDDGWVFDEWEIAQLLGNKQRLGFVGIWVSGDDLPPPFTRKNVCDFRNQERYAEEMDKIFPVRYVTVIGIRPDKTFRALTHLKRSESKQAVAKFQALKEFEYIAIVEKPAHSIDKASG